MSGGPGQLLTAVAGAIIGGMIGGPTGAAIGWTLGMTAGGIIWPLKPPDQAGPRLADKEVQSSAYGVSIPIVYGSYRLSGNVIWAKDIEERSDFTRVGRTLFSRGTKVWSYTYFGHFAVAICEGPISAIGRIWADNKLIFDPNTETEGKYDKYIRRYLGTEDQMPDSAIQAHMGIDNTPAFRGTAYVVFTGLPLADFGNRIPTIQVEVGGQTLTAQWLDGTVTNLSRDDWAYTPAQPYRTANTWSHYVTVVDTRTLTAVQWQPDTYTEPVLTADFTYETTTPVIDVAVEMFGPAYGAAFGSTGYCRPAIDPATGDVIVFLQGVTFRSMITRWKVANGAPTLVYSRAFFSEWGVGSNWVFGSKIYMLDLFRQDSYLFDIATGAEDWRVNHEAALTAFTISYVNWFGATYKAADQSIYVATTTGIWRQSLLTGAVTAQSNAFVSLATASTYAFGVVYDSVTDSVIILHDGGFIRLNPTTLAVTATYPTATPWVLLGAQRENFGINNAVSGSIWLNDGDDTFWQVSTADFSILWTGTVDPTVSGVPSSVSMGGIGADVFHIESSRPKFFGVSYGTNTYRFGDTAGSGTTLASIVADICDRCDMDADDIDVTELTSTIVPGYGILRESTGRSALEPILSAYAVDAPEIDGLLRFQFRKTALTATVQYDDLGATSDNSETVRVTERRRQEVELPARVTVTYSSKLLDYEANTQTAKRIDTTIKAGDPRSQEFPLVLDDADAQTLAKRLLYLAWVERSSYSFSLPPKWLIYDPGDIFDIPVEDNTARVMLTRVELGGDGIVRVEALATDALAFLPAVEAPVIPIFAGQTVPALEDMRLVALDAPLLSDDEDTFGYLVGGDGTTTTFSGGYVYASQDDVSYELAASVAAASPIGTGSALPARTSALIDRVNVVRVTFAYDAALSSVTELQMLAGANRAMLGNELIGFATATRVSSGVYDLTTLMRGQQGTEWASTHAAGERFVLLDDLESIEAPIADMGRTEYLKAVPLGETIDDEVATTFVPYGVRLKPLSPVNIAGSRDGGGDLTITWFRRARLDADWRDGVETPLDEPTESYSIDIMSGSTVKRTIAASSPIAVYTAAEQTTDFGSPQSSVVVKIYQISSRVGRGYPGLATI